MKHARIQQRDFFDPAPDLNIEPLDAAEMEAPRGEPIAIPCGFMTKTNERCQRLASRPVMLEGHQMTCRVSIGVQKGPPIGVQKGPPSSSSVTGMTGALFVLVAA